MQIKPIETAFLFEMTLRVSGPTDLGRTPAGTRRIVAVTGGEFAGPRLKGEVLPGGGDWIVFHEDGTAQLDVRLTLKTDDGALIYMTYRGFRHGPRDVMERLGRGEAVDPSLYYFRTAPFFETGARQYDWLNRTITVGTGSRLPTGPVYHVYEVR